MDCCLPRAFIKFCWFWEGIYYRVAFFFVFSHKCLESEDFGFLKTWCCHKEQNHKLSKDKDKLWILQLISIRISMLLSRWLSISGRIQYLLKCYSKRSCDVGLVASGYHLAWTKRRKFTNVLSKEFRDIKEWYSYHEFKLEQDVVPILYW